MKTLISILTLAVFRLFFNTNLSAQNDGNDYVIVEYMKVKSGMTDKYLECENVWKLIHQERKKAGFIIGWELEEMMFPSGTSSEYDYLTITHVENWDAIGKLEATWDDKTWAMLTKNLTAVQKETANNAPLYRDLVKREIWTAGDMVFAPGSKNQKYRVENFMAIPAGGWEEWTETESKFVKPVHEKNIATGNRAGWLMGFMVLPRGGDHAYQASTVDFYNSWEDMNKNEGQAWKEVYPDMSDDRIWKRIESTRTIIKTEVRRLVDFVE